MTDGRDPLRAVLIVEDDHLLRMFTVDMVKDAGFVALEAGNADEAVAILESRSDIVLLLTDVNMPGSMNGLNLAHAVRTRDPSIKIVIVSGLVRLAEVDLPLNSRHFTKPYDTDSMIAEIRSLAGP